MNGPAGKRGPAWETVSREESFKCPYWRMMHDRYRLPSGEVTDYFYVQTGGSTMVVPVDDRGRLLLVRQHRYLLQRVSDEFPCGGVPIGGDLDANAVKELREECGVAADELRRVGGFAPYNGVADEMCHVYIARGLHDVGSDPESTEEIEILRRSPSQVADAIDDNTIWDGMTIAAFALARPHL